MFPPEIERWRKYLRSDPTRWLLETNDPSILFWYQVDIAHRPEQARGVLETRSRILYSDAVQSILAAQNEMGFWENPRAPARRGQLTQPYYSATVWNLALLAELGMPRASRRARNACEFILTNLMAADAAIIGLGAVETGYLLHALSYFNYAGDERVIRIAGGLANQIYSYAARVSALWGWKAFREHAAIAQPIEESLQAVLTERDNADAPYTIPQFDPRDPLFLLRVLSEYGLLTDARAAPLLDALAAKQNERAQWTLERAFDAPLPVTLERPNEPSRWLTLNAVRVIVRLVTGQN